jgi:hypothetical protein
MSSSRTITLFSDRPDPFVSGSSFVVSILMHGAVIGVVALAILYGPQNHRIVTERYAVRHLELHAPEPQTRASAASGIRYPGPRLKAKTPAPGGMQSAQAEALRITAQGAPGAQTLVQPKIKNPVTLAKEIPVPTAVIWSPEKAEVKTIVPPKPAPPTASEVKPVLDQPNEEVNLADLGISASELASRKQPILPSTTSPIVVHGPDKVQLPPATTSDSAAQPTPTAVMSLSDTRMANGTVTLPPVNETVKKSSPGALAPGQGKDTSQTGSGNSPAKAAGSGTGQGAGANGEKNASAGANGKQNAGNAAPAQGADSGSGNNAGSHPGYAVIKLPKDGEFGAVVVGSSLEDKYPETAELWSGRMSYTVYLHVGLAHSWILQYSLSRADDAAAGGNTTHIEAPWPYNIVRPNITPGAIDADALMIHGFVNQAGRFEQLAVAFPPEFPQAKFVLDSLAKWEFRPATQGGQNVRVEVVLVIPEVPE